MSRSAQDSPEGRSSASRADQKPGVPAAKPPSGRRLVGIAGEAAACAHLLAKGYEVLHSNWRCRIGELDLVARKDGMLIFVEVRSRSAASAARFGTPQESVDARKQQKLRRLAEVYLQQRQEEAPLGIRFDLVAVSIGPGGAPLAIEHIENAF